MQGALGLTAGGHPCVDGICWRIARAERLSLLIDVAAYFSAAKQAMEKATRRIVLLGWDFDPRTRLEPDRTSSEFDQLGLFLNALKHRRPELEIKILCWDMALPIAYFHDFFPRRGQSWIDGGVDLRFDSSAPAGASHHQKILIVDDAVAFCGGGDFAPDRWDTSDHPDASAYRVLPSGQPYDARHDLMAVFDGDAARALVELAAERWLRGTGEVLPPLERTRDGADRWPDFVEPEFRGTFLIIARTEPETEDQTGVHESEALHLAAIGAAKKLIFLENQYFASQRIADALAERLAEPDGPEIVLMLSARSPSLFDQLAMDSPRDALVAMLRRADRHGRLSAYAPYTAGGHVIIVHSKLAIIDDCFLRVGSTNLNNRSFGFDTECDIAVEAALGPEHADLRRRIIRSRDRLIGHYLNLEEEAFAALVDRHGSLAEAIAHAPEATRLRPIEPEKPGPLGYVVARWHLFDPGSVDDNWRPWKRQETDIPDDGE